MGSPCLQEVPNHLFSKGPAFCGDKASTLAHQKTCLSIPLSDKGLAKDKVVYKQLKIFLWCYEDEVYLLDCTSCPIGRLMSWITYCGHKFGGLFLLLSYWWCNQPMGLTWSLWQVAVLQWYHWPTGGHHGGAGGCLKIEPGGNFFPSAFNNVNEFNAKSPETGLVYLVWLQNPFFNWAVRPLLC